MQVVILKKKKDFFIFWSGIKDYSQEALESMYEKFRIDDSDENAEIHFLGVVEEATKALFPVITDNIHKWVSYWRKWKKIIIIIIYSIKNIYIILYSCI